MFVMDPLTTPTNVVAITVWLLTLILNATETHDVPMLDDSDEYCEDPLASIVHGLEGSVQDTESILRETLHNYRLCTTYSYFDEDVGFWVKPRSTTWFSRFLLEEYDNSRWVGIFRMTKPCVFALAELLRPHVERENTKYRIAIPVLVRVACTLFKLTHGANLTICSEMFAIGRSTVSRVLREVVHAINDTLRHEITWPTGDRLRETQAKFSNLCGLPGVVGAIDGMHVAISKPAFGAPDYFYFKSGGYTVNCQAVVDSDKRFLDLYVGMPGSTNDSRMLRRSSLYHLAMHGNLLEPQHSVDGHTPYVVGDLGYPLLPWLMVPHRGQLQLSVSETLFNKKLRKGRCVVENAFGILKQSFRELLDKTDLHISFVPDVILCCAILHNVLLRQSHEEVEELLQILRIEGLDGAVVDEDPAVVDAGDAIDDGIVTVLGSEKRTALGVYLTMRRRPQPLSMRYLLHILKYFACTYFRMYYLQTCLGTISVHIICSSWNFFLFNACLPCDEGWWSRLGSAGHLSPPQQELHSAGNSLTSPITVI